MKTLYLFRHAKSSWDDPALDDFERPLNERGERSAPLMGKVMSERKVKPDVVICSPAERTRQTAKLALKPAEIELEVLFDDRVYLSSEKQLREILSELSDKVNEALLIGHNPGMENLQGVLTGRFEHFPTAALARVLLDIKSWKDLQKGIGRLDWLAKPRDFE